MNPGDMTDDELFRLAKLLQRMRGEGLAFINAGEAQMLKDEGGSGEPIAGTQGLGVGGGPIRSYYFEDVSSGGSRDAGASQDARDYGTYASSGLDNPIHDRPTAPHTGSGGGGYTPPPPKYYDVLGREHSSPGARDAANARIAEQRAQLATEFTDLTTDADFNFFTSHSGTPNFTLGKDAVLIFEGSSDDANETTLSVANPSQENTITLPDATGTVVVETSS